MSEDLTLEQIEQEQQILPAIEERFYHYNVRGFFTNVGPTPDPDLPLIEKILRLVRQLLIREYVPYEGANNEVNLEDHKLIFEISESEKTIEFTGDKIKIITSQEDYDLIFPNKSGTIATTEDIEEACQGFVTVEDHDYIIPPEDR